MQRKVSESALSAARATKMTQRESRVAWQLWLGMVLFLASSVASVGVAQTALGGLFWDCQTNGSDGGHASTQAQAVENWLARMNGFFMQAPAVPSGPVNTVTVLSIMEARLRGVWTCLSYVPTVGLHLMG